MFWMLWTPVQTEPLPAASAPPSPQRAVPPSDTPAPKDAEAISWVDAFVGAFGDQAVCCLTGKGETTYLSPHWRTLTGIDPALCKGKRFATFLHPGFRPRLAEKLRAGLRASKEGGRFKCQLKHRSGEWQWYEVAVCASRQGEKGPEYVCVFRNTSEEVQSRKTLEKAKLEAELALRGRSEFLASMSHELRTPLNAVIGFSQLMASQVYGRITNKRYLDYLANIQDSGQLLLSRIGDLLELSNVEAGRISLHEDEVDLADVVRSAVEIHSRQAFSRHVRLHKEMEETLKLRGDRVKLKQIVSNLLSNALKFTPIGGTVTLRCAVNRGGDVQITLADTGKGMPPQQLQTLRDLLSDSESFFDIGEGRLGLGLALVKEFVNLHQGKIALDSEAGVGTTISIILPRSRLIEGGATARRRQRAYS